MPAPALGDLTYPGTDLAADRHPLYAHLRAQGPVHRVRTPDERDAWLVVGHEEARAALADPRLSCDLRHSPDWSGDGGYAIGVNMLQTDPPDHTRLRRLVAREFTAQRMEALRPRIVRLAERLVADLPSGGRADLVESFALPLPLTVICHLLGVPPADRADFRAWSDEMVQPTSEAAAAAAAGAMTDHLARLIEAKRTGPEDDLLSALIRTADDDGDRLSSAELLGMAFLLLVAGHETTVNLISSTLLNLLQDPGRIAALRADPGLTAAAVEETLRHDSPVERAAYRYTKEPVEIGGTLVPARQAVIVVLSAAARDPQRFPEPDRFDLHRDARGHLAFGHGVHHCLGAPLARLEAAVAVETLLRLLPGLALDADPADLQWRPSLALRGLRALPVRY
ncbi:cytochrome P450 [Streptomyces sp. NPDC049555]|uniref:cytochrome P450 family protein n=1 Tax=Streptomyces sp. NPDC049555 TaxID=3154930 RepID=UPI00344996D9